MSRRGFTIGAAGAVAGLAALGWLKYFAPAVGGIPWPLRWAHELNEGLSRAAFSTGRLAPTYPASAAVEPRVNGTVGLAAALDADRWRLHVEDDRGGALRLSLADVRALPRTEVVTELRCVEGWSTVVHWAGVRVCDFMGHYRLGTRSGAAPDPEARWDDLFGYVSLETPDRGYYVGLDMAAALHPQTLLCYEMNGAPLTPVHGAPLRLVVPVKYGYKSIKRIGLVRFIGRRPADYWAERGYDWYAGH
jgi:DMSO/TMAO reductase YedYZ molybdopterin-dependent catalytic subunit